MVGWIGTRLGQDWTGQDRIGPDITYILNIENRRGQAVAAAAAADRDDDGGAISCPCNE